MIKIPVKLKRIGFYNFKYNVTLKLYLSGGV